LTAVALIEDYLKQHGELTFGQRKFSAPSCGTGVGVGRHEQSGVRHLDQAMSGRKTPGTLAGLG
jgi:hypothetical protein